MHMHEDKYSSGIEPIKGISPFKRLMIVLFVVIGIPAIWLVLACYPWALVTFWWQDSYSHSIAGNAEEIGPDIVVGDNYVSVDYDLTYLFVVAFRRERPPHGLMLMCLDKGAEHPRDKFDEIRISSLVIHYSDGSMDSLIGPDELPVVIKVHEGGDTHEFEDAVRRQESFIVKTAGIAWAPDGIEVPFEMEEDFKYTRRYWTATLLDYMIHGS